MNTPHVRERRAEETPRFFWEPCAVPASGSKAEADRHARATWSALAESTDAAARYLWLARGPIEALSIALEGSIREIASALEEAACNPEAELLHVTAAHESMRIRNARHAAERAKAAWTERVEGARDVLERSMSSGIELVRPGEPGWPAGFSALGINAPFALWHAGSRRTPSEGKAVALVGARGATRYGTSVARDFAAALAERGVRVVSGGALGIDAAAHSGALAARSVREGGGGTAAFLAGGLDDYYPRACAAKEGSIPRRPSGHGQPGGVFSRAIDSLPRQATRRLSSRPRGALARFPPLRTPMSSRFPSVPFRGP